MRQKYLPFIIIAVCVILLGINTAQAKQSFKIAELTAPSFEDFINGANDGVVDPGNLPNTINTGSQNANTPTTNPNQVDVIPGSGSETVPEEEAANETEASSGNLVLLGSDIGCTGPDCGFVNLVNLAQAIIDFIIVISIPISAGLFIYAGFLYVTAVNDSGKVSQAKLIFKTVAIGFTIILSGWLIVYAIITGLVNETTATGFLQFF